MVKLNRLNTDGIFVIFRIIQQFYQFVEDVTHCASYASRDANGIKHFWNFQSQVGDDLSTQYTAHSTTLNQKV